ncbi:hypothetical protein ACEPAH_274 [Sanghuangporus vaninii]
MSTKVIAPFLLTPSEFESAVASAHAGKKVVTLDASWHMPNSPRRGDEEFKAKHLPGARFLDLDAVASPHELGLKHMMPSPEQFAKACQGFGITPDTHVVIYDSHGIFSAPRALFMFRAFGHTNSSVLDGGLPRWEAEGLPVEMVETEVKQTDEAKYPPPAYDASVVKSYEQIVSNAELDPSADSVASLVVDARPKGRFIGQDPEPRPGLPSGHIPNAFSLPFSAFLQQNTAPSGVVYTTFLPPDGLRKALVDAIGEKNAKDVLEGRRPIIASCGSGMSAGVLWLGLRILGVEKPTLYDESWTGYTLRKESKIVKDV